MNLTSAPSRIVLTLAAWLSLALLVRSAAADPLPMTPEEMIALARPAVGHGYHWGHGNWTTDGSEIGECSKTGNNGCPDCTFSGSFGTDCSGFVAKVWQVPDPSAVEFDVHPYSTGSFAAGSSYWADLPADRSDVQRGDAFVKGGSHIVMVDQRISPTEFMVYHAAGCDKGVRHEAWTASSSFKPIRRNLVDTTACTPESCNSHGDCNDDGTCHCQAGYAGDHCERCVPGFTGYPNCVAQGCGFFHKGGELRCGKSFTLALKGNGNSIEDYGCGVSGQAAEEIAFAFNPAGVGSATVRLGNGGGANMMLLRNECAPDTNCAASASDELSFDFGGNDRFFVVLDAPAAVAGKVTISVECTVPRTKWIGDPCTTDEECPDWVRVGQASIQGHCYRGPSASFCSIPCTGSCPDTPNAAPTVCIADPADESKGMCTLRSHARNAQCTEVPPGTQAKEVNKFGKTTKVEACVPVEDADACEGTFNGRVVDAVTGEAVAAATIGYADDMGSAMLSSDASGQFSSEALSCGNRQLDVQAAGYSPAQVVFDQTEGRTEVPLIRLQPLSTPCEGTAAANGRVIDGVSNMPVSGATVEVRGGQNATGGAVLLSTTSAADGQFALGGLAAGDYTLSATDARYPAGATRSIQICGGTDLGGQDLFLTPPNSGALRFVLNWTRPADLDLHLLLPTGEDLFFDDACRGSLDEAPYAYLDVDHREADGPETITIADFLPGRYELFVHNFSAENDDAPEQFSDTEATLVVYDGADQVIERFFVPTSGTGFYWDVLSVEGGSDTPEIQPMQALGSSRPNPYDEYAGICNPY